MAVEIPAEKPYFAPCQTSTAPRRAGRLTARTVPCSELGRNEKYKQCGSAIEVMVWAMSLPPLDIFCWAQSGFLIDCLQLTVRANEQSCVGHIASRLLPGWAFSVPKNGARNTCAAITCLSHCQCLSHCLRTKPISIVELGLARMAWSIQSALWPVAFGLDHGKESVLHRNGHAALSRNAVSQNAVCHGESCNKIPTTGLGGKTDLLYKYQTIAHTCRRRKLLRRHKISIGF